MEESEIKGAVALEWFGELGYVVGYGPRLAPGEPVAERESFGEVVLMGRLRATLLQINPMIPEGARATIRQFPTVPYERRLHP
jgi:type I restriction enzyme R subunit